MKPKIVYLSVGAWILSCLVSLYIPAEAATQKATAVRVTVTNSDQSVLMRAARGNLNAVGTCEDEVLKRMSPGGGGLPTGQPFNPGEAQQEARRISRETATAALKAKCAFDGVAGEISSVQLTDVGSCKGAGNNLCYMVCETRGTATCSPSENKQERPAPRTKSGKTTAP